MKSLRMIVVSALTAGMAIAALADYNYTAELTVAGYQGEGTLADFPVLVRISPERISGFTYARCQADGKDILFTSPDGGTTYPHEIDTWNAGGESLVWVRLPSLSGTATKFLFKFGDSGVAEAPSGTNVWASASGGVYMGVWHLGETATAETAADTLAADSAKRSPSHDMNLEPKKGSADDMDISKMVSVSGMVGQGRQIQDTTGYKPGGNGLVAKSNYGLIQPYLITDTFTFSGWVSVYSPRVYNSWLATGKSENAHQGWNLALNNNTGVSVLGNGAAGAVNATVPAVGSGWYHLAVVFEGTTATIYTNGAVSASGTLGAAASRNSKFFALGNVGNACGGYPLRGAFDEARILSVAASADWLQAEYDTAANANFITYGAVQTPDESLVITATSDALGTPSPAYGSITDFSGGPILLSAPDVDQAVSDTLRVAFAGWTLQRMDGNGDWQTIDSAATNQYLYVHPGGAVDRFIWNVVRKRPVVLSASPAGAGTFAIDGVAAVEGTNYVAEGEVVVSASPTTGYDFLYWDGDKHGVETGEVPVEVPNADAAVNLVALFLSNGEEHEPVTMAYTGASGGDWDDAANWEGGVVPQKGDFVYLTNSVMRVVTLSSTVPRLGRLVVSNATLVVSNWLTRVEADEILIAKGGTVKTAGAILDGAESNRVWLVGGTLEVAAGGKIVADGAGYGGRNGPAWAGVTAYSREVAGVYGGPSTGGSVPEPPSPYGSVEFPADPGSGAGRNQADSAVSNAGGIGGGAIRLDISGAVVVDGEITALPVQNAVGLRGSGGAVWIDCTTVSGTGRVDVSGGQISPPNQQFCGGGGRIAVHYDAAAQSNVSCRVAFRAQGGLAYDYIKNNVILPGVNPLSAAYGRSTEDGAYAAEHGTLYFTDNQFLFSSEYLAAGMPLGGEWHSGEPLDEISWTGPVSLANTALKFPMPLDFTVSGDLSISGSGFFARRNFGLTFSNSQVRVTGALSLVGARLEMRGGDLIVDGNCAQTAISGVTSRFAGGELALKAMPTNSPNSYGATLTVNGTWSMATNTVTCPFCEPDNGAIVKMSAQRLVMDLGSEINADEKGWRLKSGPGVPSVYTTGASHGGLGSATNDKSPPAGVYDSETHPLMPGSGGATAHAHAGYDGGGVVLLDVARTFTFNGVISADGNTRYAGYYASGSSGGSINVTAHTLSGETGRFRAQGGFSDDSARASYGAVGGGGRIAIRTGNAPWSAAAQAERITVAPGGARVGVDGSTFGATAGTVFWGRRATGVVVVFQ